MNYDFKIKIVIGVILLFIVSNFSVAGLNQITPINNFESLHSYNPITNINKYLSGWPQIYNGGSDDEAWGMAIDSQNNIIVTGYSVDKSISRANIFTIKYDNEGNEIWNISYDSGIDDVGFDVTVDSEDNIIIIGFSGSSNNWNGNFIVIKYNKDGIKQWSRTYRKGISSFAGGIVTDSNDNIIISGSTGDINQMNVSAWTIKIDSNGNEIWNKVFRESWSDFSLGITIGPENNIITVGITISPMIGGGFSLVNYDENGNVIWWRSYGGNQGWDLAIDSKGNIIMVGDYYSDEDDYLNWFIIKCDNKGETLWIQEYDSGQSDSPMSVAIDSYDNVIVGGSSSFSKYQNYEHCLIIYDQDGTELCMKRPEIMGSLMDVAVDHSDTIVVTGSKRPFSMGISDFYTDKYFDITPPSVQMEKPVEKNLYLFNIKLIPLPKNTLVIGGLTISMNIDDPNDIVKVEFYIDNQLMETVTETPYEWSWSDKTFGKHTIKTMTYDDSGNVARKECEIIKIL